MKYILIYVIVVTGGFAGDTPAVTTGSVEFDSQATCQSAVESMKKDLKSLSISCHQK
ncbi:MAG: hypothetical protein G01um101456_29 [Parcubacteria group bacterium Gr01-1014_56]|nr:MAG: hypothetical protein G01um101456_29 [Parcubacteria group bacterium Gr01-1014_56]